MSVAMKNAVVAGLVTLVLLLALLDMANTWRMTWAEKRELRRKIEGARAALRAAHEKSGAPEKSQRV